MNRKDVYLLMPVVNEAKCREHIGAWKQQGYRIVLLQDRVRFDVPEADLISRPWDEYAGYAHSVNFLLRAHVPMNCQLIVLAGEDMRPDPNHTAQQIHDIFFERFSDGFGVMQPTGDDLPGTNRICGSPFIGTWFARQWNAGIGPLWSGYNHFFADEELYEVTKMRGLLWQNDKLTHYHDHWTRGGVPKPSHHAALQARWEHDKALFGYRKAKGFPGHTAGLTAAQAIQNGRSS